MARTTVRVEGLREIDKALGDLTKATGKNILRRVGRSRLEPMAEAARQKVPVDQSDLKDSIAVSAKNPKRHRKQSTVEIHMGPGRHPQAHLQEFGTLHHGPKAYMRPAWDGGKNELLTDIGRDLWSEIDKAAKRAARKAVRQARG